MVEKRLGRCDRLDVGDVIKKESWSGTQSLSVVRVTAKFAFVDNGGVEEKYPRSIKVTGIHPCGSTNQWDQELYSAWRPVSS